MNCEFAPVENLLNSFQDNPVATLELEGNDITSWKQQQRTAARKWRSIFHSALLTTQYGGSLVDAPNLESLTNVQIIEEEAGKVVEYNAKVAHAREESYTQYESVNKEGLEIANEILINFENIEERRQVVKDTLLAEFRQFGITISTLANQGVSDEDTLKKEKEREQIQKEENEFQSIYDQLLSHQLNPDRISLTSEIRLMKELKQTVKDLNDDVANKLFVFENSFALGLSCLETCADDELDDLLETQLQCQSLDFDCEKTLNISLLDTEDTSDEKIKLQTLRFLIPQVLDFEIREPRIGPYLKYLDILWAKDKPSCIDDIVFKVDLSKVSVAQRSNVWADVVLGVKQLKQWVKDMQLMEPSFFVTLFY